jgi:hypothetical protein
MKLGRKPGTIVLDLPASDQNWVPKDLSMDIEATYNELKQGKPAGVLFHTWR